MAPKGASFLFHPAGSLPVFSPEQFGEEHLRLYRTAYDFTRDQVLPHAARIEGKDHALLVSLLRRAGELGLLMVGVPEAYGGLELDKVHGMLVAEAITQLGSWNQTFAAHAGLGTSSLVLYGTLEQKARYLPRLVTGEWIAAYALSEPGAGSDALGIQTTATLGGDGRHYLLNGSKQWITNAAFADLFTLFARVDGKFTAFLVERRTPGLTVGRDEKKMGLRGASTCTLGLADVPVPIENVLGEVGRGHKVAFNVLNLGRLSLGAYMTGASKVALGAGVRYAMERRQFGRPIVEFGLVREKIARAVAQVYAIESMVYRTAGAVGDTIAELEEQSVEASLVKVHASEVAGLVADEMLQIHGGNGYTEDYLIERLYRDLRVSRIYEGTNEVNRLLIPATILRRAARGELELFELGARMDEELAAGALPRFDGPLASERRVAELVKRMFVLAARAAALAFGEGLSERQEVLGALADVAIEAYALDSVCARTLGAADPVRQAAVQVYALDGPERAFRRARWALCATAQGDELERLLGDLTRLREPASQDPVRLHEALLPAALHNEGYPFPFGA